MRFEGLLLLDGQISTVQGHMRSRRTDENIYTGLWIAIFNQHEVAKTKLFLESYLTHTLPGLVSSEATFTSGNKARAELSHCSLRLLFCHSNY